MEYNVSNARKNLYSIINEVAETYTPCSIVNKKGKRVVLVSEEEWNGINETLYLYSIPGLVESILEGKKENVDEMVEYTEEFWDDV